MVNTIFILDEYYKAQKVLTVNGENTFFDDLYALDLSTGVESFEFSTNVDDIDESNYIMFYYHDQYKLFQITEVEQEHSEGKIITYCYGESACLELLNGAVRAFRKDEGFTCVEFFEHVLRGTDWSIGKYSSSLAEKSIPINVDKTTQIWSCIQDHMDVYGYELNTRVVYENGYVKYKLIDIYAEGELGNKTYKRFEYGRNVEGIIKKKDLYDWCTALIIEASAEIVGDNLDYNKDGYTKDATSDVILATKENEKYNLGREYVYGVFEDNTSPSGQEAIEKAVEELKRRAVPHFDYECTTVMTYKEYEDVSIGDTVYVIDHSFNPSITLEARVGRLEISFTDRNNCSCNLTNYKEIKSGIDMKLSAGIKDIVNTYLPITSAGIAEGAIIDGKIDTKYYEQITADIISGSKVVAEELIAGEAAIIYAQIGTLEAEDASIKNLVATKATIDELNATKANIQEINTNLLNADKAIIKDLNATNATIDNLDTKFANIDFANIGELAVEKLFADSGIIGDLVMKDGAVTGTLVGVTIKGDLIEGNTIVAEKLIIKGTDGLFYKLNTDGVNLSTEQTDYNSLNGSIITAKSVTAEKINVSDLVAFDATIGGFKIGNDKLYSGVKASVDNTTRGIYLDNTGQIAFGDKDNYIKYYKKSDNSYALEISALEDLTLSSDKINLHGYITANGNFKIDTEGNMEAKNGKFSGTITGSKIIGSGDGNRVLINNGDYEIQTGGTTKGFFGLRTLDDGFDTARLALSSTGLNKNSDNYFVIVPYNGNGYNPQSYDLPYVDIAYRCPQFVDSRVGYGDCSNIKMYADGIMRISPIQKLQITTNFSEGTYASSGERHIAEFGSANHPYYNMYLDVRALRNYQNDNGLVMCTKRTDRSEEAGIKLCVYAADGFRTLRPIPTTSEGIPHHLGSGDYRWTTVYSVNSLNTSSDITLKENIKYLSDTPNTKAIKDEELTIQDMYDFIKNDLYLTSYNWKHDESKDEKLGFIAQDIVDTKMGEKIIVCNRDMDNTLGYDTGNFEATIAGALQVAIQKIEQLEAKIQELENKQGV